MSDYIPKTILYGCHLLEISGCQNYQYCELWYATCDSPVGIKTIMRSCASYEVTIFTTEDYLFQTAGLDNDPTATLIKVFDVKRAYRVNVFCENPDEFKKSAQLQTICPRLCNFFLRSQLSEEFIGAGIQYFHRRQLSSSNAPSVNSIYQIDIDKLTNLQQSVRERLKNEALALQNAHGDMDGVAPIETGD